MVHGDTVDLLCDGDEPDSHDLLAVHVQAGHGVEQESRRAGEWQVSQERRHSKLTLTSTSSPEGWGPGRGPSEGRGSLPSGSGSPSVPWRCCSLSWPPPGRGAAGLWMSPRRHEEPPVPKARRYFCKRPPSSEFALSVDSCPDFRICSFLFLSYLRVHLSGILLVFQCKSGNLRHLFCSNYSIW